MVLTALSGEMAYVVAGDGDAFVPTLRHQGARHIH